ncbi:MAG: HEAT repeat domain-containing protein, partial [Candidatus Brocadiia bacterium]|nr:HEAT repeat domain-containing protein [Candidatus Brocadiia bacterium]
MQDELAGKQVRCPQCGATIEVPLPGGQATAKTPAPGPEGAAEEGAGQAMPPGHHPARQVCHTCGVVLGVRAVFCPKCGTDVRTGAAVEAKAGGAKKRNLAPLVIAGLGVIVLALVGGDVYLVVKNWDAITGAKEGEAGAQKAEAPVDLGPKLPPRPDRSKRSRAGGERTSRRSSRSSRKASSASKHVPGEEEKKLAETITDYRARLKDTAVARETASGPDEMAARWTDLYEFCRDNGLHAEAEQCWYRAALLEPRDLDINERLGRTETWRGFAVTAEQARFLQGFRTQVRVVNNEPMLPEVRLQLPGGRAKTLSAGQSVTFTVQPGEIAIPFQEGALSGDDRGSVKVCVREGEVGTITFLGRYQRELIPSSALRHIHRGMALWRRAGPSKQGGWTKTEQGYVLKTKGKPAVTFGLGEGQRLESIRLKGATLTGASDDGLLFDVREGVVTVVGKLELSSQKGDWVLTGTEKLPVRLDRGAQALVRSGLVRHGKRTAAYRAADAAGRLTYTAETQLGPRLRDVVQVASRKLSGEAVKGAQASSRKRLEAQARDAEARGKLTGGWDSELWVARKHKPVQDEQWERWQVEERARALPTGADKAARLGAGEREAVLYLNWQRFRRPLAEVYGAGVADQFEALGEAAVLPLMPEDAVARFDSVSAASGDGGPEGRKETAWQLRFANSGSALGALERIASSASNPAVRAEALLALGSIGTARALAACRVVTIQSQVRAAKLAALAAAGDEPTLESLAETLKSEPKTKKLFLNDLVRIDVPTVLLALERVLPLYTSQKDRAVMARKLGRTGGNAAMSVLGDLIAQAGEPYEEVVSEVPPAERLPLVGSLAGMLRQGGKHARAAALLIAQTRSPAALAVLKEAAVKGKLPEAVEGLALLGSAEALEAAAEAKDVAGTENLDRIFESWRKAPEPGGRFIWQPEVDGRAAVGFLQEVLRSWEGAEVRMRAAELLGRLGEKPDAGALVAVASTPVTARKKKPAATTGTGSRRGPPQGMGPGFSGPPEGMGPGGPGPAGRGPGVKPTEPKPKGPDMWRPLKESREAVEGTPQMRALELLAENIDPGVLPDLRRLGEKAANIEIKGKA